MRPALKSGLLPVWRDRDTLQIGIDPRRAIALSGMGKAAFVIGLLDGSRERDQIIAVAAGHGIPVEATERILTLLAAGGALDDFPASTFRAIPPDARARLAPELATTSLAHRDGDGGARALARRRAAAVRIEGDQRIGRAAARILAAAGVGRVEFVRPHSDARQSDAAASASAGHLRIGKDYGQRDRLGRHGARATGSPSLTWSFSRGGSRWPGSRSSAGTTCRTWPSSPARRSE